MRALVDRHSADRRAEQVRAGSHTIQLRPPTANASATAATQAEPDGARRRGAGQRAKLRMREQQLPPSAPSSRGTRGCNWKSRSAILPDTITVTWLNVAALYNFLPSPRSSSRPLLPAPPRPLAATAERLARAEGAAAAGRRASANTVMFRGRSRGIPAHRAWHSPQPWRKGRRWPLVGRRQVGDGRRHGAVAIIHSRCSIC